jgi:hypothetical protein
MKVSEGRVNIKKDFSVYSVRKPQHLHWEW